MAAVSEEKEDGSEEKEDGSGLPHANRFGGVHVNAVFILSPDTSPFVAQITASTELEQARQENEQLKKELKAFIGSIFHH